MDKLKHIFIPEHVKITDEEKEALFEQYKISIRDLPKISINDPAIAHLEPQSGDVFKVLRKSKTSGDTVFYRSVLNE